VPAEIVGQVERSAARRPSDLGSAGEIRGDLRTGVAVQLPQRLCPTTQPCYGGDSAHRWTHAGHPETDNIVVTPTLEGTTIALTATEVTSSGTNSYDGTADAGSAPLVFRGHMANSSTKDKPVVFTLTRMS
jgi:hypothetical protein